MHAFPDFPVETRAVERRAQVQIVKSRSLPYQANFRQVGPCASIGTAGHTNRDGLFFEIVFDQQRFNQVNQVRQLTLAFSHG